MIKITENVYEIEKDDIKQIFKKRESASHKGMFGTVGIMGGSSSYPGAVKLATLGASALRAGCGVSRIIVPESLHQALLPLVMEETIFALQENEKGNMKFGNDIKEATKNLSSLAIGMGWGKDEGYKEIIEYLATNFKGSLLIDADGLNTISQMGDIKFSCKTVLTPHLKEFERLSKISIDEIKKDKINICMKYAKEKGIILLLKGEKTIVTDGDTCYIVSRGTAGMATSGSGDVLSGVIVGLLGYNELNILTVASGAYLAGVAGEMADEKYTDISHIATDTIAFLPDAIKYIRKD